MKSLVGKFVHIVQDEYYFTGEILDVSSDLLLLHNDPFGGSTVGVKRLIPIPVVWEEMSIFDTRKEMEAWLAWIDEPSENSKPKVISINAKKKE